MRPNNNGFTLFEIVIAITIVCILSTIALISYIKTIPDKHLKSAATQLYLDFQNAKSNAVLNRQNITISFDSDNDSYTINLPNGAKTVNLSDFGSGVCYGPGPAQSPKAGTDWGSNYITFDKKNNAEDVDNDFTGFKPNGMALKLGYVYLTNQNNTMCYAVGIPSVTGIVRIFKTAKETWQ